MTRSFNFIFAALLVVCATSVMAVIEAAAAEVDEQGRHSVRAFLGFISPDNESRLGDDDVAAMLVAAYEYRPYRHLAIGGELQAIARTYRPDLAPAGFFTDPDRDSDVDSAGLAGTLRGFLPLGNVELFGGVGLGLYYTEMSITGETNNVDGSFYESDSGFGYFAMLGADIAIAENHRLTVEFRKLWLEADLNKLAGGDVDIGGDILSLGYQYRF